MKSLITKVKITISKVVISSQDQESRGESTYTSPDRPLPEFDAALQGLKQSICDICGFDDEYSDKLFVKGVSWKETGKKTGVILTASKTLEDGSMTINTPLTAFEAFDDSERATLAEIKSRAIEYLEGKRAQQEMFTDTPAPKAKAEKPVPEETSSTEVTPEGKIEPAGKAKRTAKKAK